VRASLAAKATHEWRQAHALRGYEAMQVSRRAACMLAGKFLFSHQLHVDLRYHMRMFFVLADEFI
jgi:hypothetical protein